MTNIAETLHMSDVAVKLRHQKALATLRFLFTDHGQ